MLGFIIFIGSLTAWGLRKMKHQTVNLKYTMQLEELMATLRMGALEGKISSEHAGYKALKDILVQARTRVSGLNFWTIWGASFTLAGRQKEVQEKWKTYRSLVDSVPFLVAIDSDLQELLLECVREKHQLTIKLVGTPLAIIFSLLLRQRDFRLKRMLENYSLIDSGELITC